MYKFNKETPPKEIIASALQSIADILIPHQFKYSKSNGTFKKKSKKFCFEIDIQSNRYNQRGLYVEFIILNELEINL